MSIKIKRSGHLKNIPIDGILSYLSNVFNNFKGTLTYIHILACTQTFTCVDVQHPIYLFHCITSYSKSSAFKIEIGKTINSLNFGDHYQYNNFQMTSRFLRLEIKINKFWSKTKPWAGDQNKIPITREELQWPLKIMFYTNVSFSSKRT